MRSLLEASLLVCALTLALPAAAQEEGPAVPVDKAAYHVPVFRNDYVALLRVNIPPQRSAGYHIHSTDQISVLIEEADQAGQVLGQAPTPPRRNPRGGVTYTAYSMKAMTHRVNNVGATAFHNIVITLREAQPGRFSPGLREGAGYTQIIDNERVRAWRLVLEPGQTAAECPRPPGDHRRRRNRRNRPRRARSRHGAATRRFLLAGAGRHARCPQYRNNSSRTGGIRIEVMPSRAPRSAAWAWMPVGTLRDHRARTAQEADRLLEPFQVGGGLVG